MIKRKENKKSNEVPLWAQVISAVYYTGAFLGLILGLIMIFGTNIIVSFMISQNTNLIPFITEGLILGLGVITIGLGILSFFVGRGLWKLKIWARIAAIMILILIVIAGFLIESLDCFGTGL
jgi:hypothetical protein